MNTASTARTVAAWGVHLYTGLGAPLGLLALEASGRGNFGLAFLWMAIATVVDATDGALARRVGVKQVLPHFDGAKLDDIVDYLNYVVVPIVLAYQAGLIPTGWAGLVIGSAPLLASGYGFCQSEAKTPDHFFTGFPSYWNIVVFYLYALRTPPWFNVAALLVLTVLVFVPIRYLYPSRSSVARKRTYALGIAWGLLVAVLLLQFPLPSRLLAAVSLYFPIYYFVASIHIHLQNRGSDQP
ncbi:MAG: CDP-diacylglycerol O-phosphatidyltransferase [Deltaproteobacteria bacterium]|nr:CDP-diacylglycerol O-phosphatidyltransferase [Deltaproteobacteria bacterium]